jgi:hypothetical protein
VLKPALSRKTFFSYILLELNVVTNMQGRNSRSFLYDSPPFSA